MATKVVFIFLIIMKLREVGEWGCPKCGNSPCTCGWKAEAHTKNDISLALGVCPRCGQPLVGSHCDCCQGVEGPTGCWQCGRLTSNPSGLCDSCM